MIADSLDGMRLPVSMTHLDCLLIVSLALLLSQMLTPDDLPPLALGTTTRT
jgi:hypothetical protein